MGAKVYGYGDNIMQLYLNGAGMSDIGQEAVKAVHEVPLWVWVVLGMAGVCGEAWRASTGPALTWQSILKRIALRSGAASLFGFATFLLIHAYSNHAMVGAAAGILVGLLGADVASGVYERWIMKKAGMNE